MCKKKKITKESKVKHYTPVNRTNVLIYMLLFKTRSELTVIEKSTTYMTEIVD